MDTKGNVVQVRKAGDVPQSNIYDVYSQLIATVSNANASQIAFANFEVADPLWPIAVGSHIELTGDGHTGNACRKVLPGTPNYGPGKNLMIPGPGKYTVSCWIKTEANYPGYGVLVFDTPTLTGSLQSYNTTYFSDTQGTWKYFETSVDVTNPALTYPLQISAYPYHNNSKYFLVDDIRIHPADAMMKTYTYNLLVGKSSETDENNTTTFYDYDGLGRLKLIMDENKNFLKRFTYNVKTDN